MSPKTEFPSLLLLLGLAVGCRTAVAPSSPVRGFAPERDLLSLHYDHAPDKDDGHSAAADRTLLETLYGADWLADHAVAVSGAYGENAGTFDRDSDAVMNATWNDRGGWLAAHDDPTGVRERLVARWGDTLARGGDVWVKEGGQSDITADVVARLRDLDPDLETRNRIHVVQHSEWNEKQTTDASLAYTRTHTAYLHIRDANTYLNVKGGDADFVRAALAHPVFGASWEAAFAYYSPDYRLDFSDTGELLHILGLGVIGFDEFRERFLGSPSDPSLPAGSPGT